LLAAYVDESGNSDLFTLSCLVADYQAWVWFDLDWQQSLTEIRIACSNCQTEIIIPFGREIPTFLECPGCNKHFWGNGHQGKAYQFVQSIFGSLRNWNQSDLKEFSLSCSLTQPTDPSSREQLRPVAAPTT
jgi:hypothetical protein